MLGDRRDLAAVWSAALTAAADRGTAEDVTVAVMTRDRLRRSRGAAVPRRRLVAEAVREVVACAPCAPLAGLGPEEREAVALARFARFDVDEIAAETGVDARLVKRRLSAGARALARSHAPQPSVRAANAAASARLRNLSFSRM